MKRLTRGEFSSFLAEHNVKKRLVSELRFVPEEITDWEQRDFLAVMNRSRSEGVIVAPFEQTFVVPFSLQPRTANSKGRVEAVICDFCATWRRGTESATITFQKKGSSSTFLCCEDLLCSLHIRDMTTASKLSRTQLRETNDVMRRIERLRKKLETILQEIE
jgi:hypothetical protein